MMMLFELPAECDATDLVVWLDWLEETGDSNHQMLRQLISEGVMPRKHMHYSNIDAGYAWFSHPISSIIQTIDAKETDGLIDGATWFHLSNSLEFMAWRQEPGTWKTYPTRGEAWQALLVAITRSKQ